MFKERRECWNERLRNSCKEVFSLKPIREYFFLTGSAALSVFWLGHRRIDNLDFFTVKDVDFTELGLYFKNIFSKKLSGIERTIYIDQSSRKNKFRQGPFKHKNQKARHND